MDVYIGMIFAWAVPWCPQDFMFCDGSTLPIHSYMPLYALIGTTYGGDGVSTFALPDLRSRFPLGCSNGSAVGPLPPASLGDRGGAGSVQISSANMPAHMHAISGTATVNGSLMASSSAATTSSPAGNYLANANYPGDPNSGIPAFASNAYVSAANAGTPEAVAGLSISGSLQNLTTQIAGAGAPMNVMPPFTVLNYIIAVNGLYPPRP